MPKAFAYLLKKKVLGWNGIRTILQAAKQVLGNRICPRSQYQLAMETGFNAERVDPVYASHWKSNLECYFWSRQRIKWQVAPQSISKLQWSVRNEEFLN